MHLEIIQQAINSKTHTKCIETIKQDISKEERILEKLIVDNQSILISNCTMMSNLTLNYTLGPITDKIKDSSLNILILHEQAKENKDLLKKTNEIFDLLVTLKNILERTINTDRLFEDYVNFEYFKTNIKLFKRFRFYDDLKVLFKEKKMDYINKLHERADQWTILMMDLYESIGERVLKNEEIPRSEFKVTKILEPLYFCKKLDMCEEFCEYMNNKRTNINKHLGIQEMIGFLFIENILVDINEGFKLIEFNSSYEKDDLITVIYYLKKNNYNFKKQEQRLEKLCCDFIFAQREGIQSKEETEQFYNKTSNFLKNVDQPCVIEVFYKCLDDLIIKFYRDGEIYEAIDRFMSFKNVNFDFRSKEKAKEMLQDIKNKVDEIFERESYDDLKQIVFTKEIIAYIRDKFINKLKTSRKNDERKIEAEAVKFYVYIKNLKLEGYEVFREVIDFSKTINIA